jgi:hypothetical protein
VGDKRDALREQHVQLVRELKRIRAVWWASFGTGVGMTTDVRELQERLTACAVIAEHALGLVGEDVGGEADPLRPPALVAVARR